MELLGKPPYDYHCFLVYMRGYGKSTHITDNVERDYNEIWGEDLLAFAKAMGIKSFYYTGVSHGNFAGWYAAFNHPEVLKGYQEYAYKRGVFSRPFLNYLYAMVPYIIKEEELVQVLQCMKDWFARG